MSTITPFIKEPDFYRILIESIPQGVQINQMIYNEMGEPVDYLILDINHTIEKYVGHVGLKKEQIIGKRVKEIFPDTEPEWFIQYGEVVKTGKPARFEMCYRPFGQWYEVQVISFRSQNKFAILSQNITELKNKEIAEKNAAAAEKALRERTNELEETNRQKIDILESISDCFYALDRELRFTYVNNAAEKIWGLSRAELLGRKIDDVFSGLIEISLSKFHQVLKEQTPQHYQVFSKIVETWGAMSVYPTKEGISVYFRDITERKKMEELLRKERQCFFDVLETLPIMICLITPDYQTPFANKAFREKFGVAEGRYCYEYCCGLTEPCPFCESLLPLETGQPHNWEFRSTDGSSIIDVYDFPFSDTDGSPMILEMDIDITDRKQAEEALQESKKIALDLVKILRKSDQNKNAFINMLSHELRNPLASIIMSLELLGKLSSGGEQTTMALDIAKRQSKQLTNLVDDLLDITRINQNKLVLKNETLEINDLIDKAVQDYQSQFIDKNVKLEVKLTSPLYIEADYSRLTQVIGNLLHNAAKFTNENDLVVVSVAEDTNTGEAVITVQDTGQGIDPKDQTSLFEPLMQVDKSLDRRLGGLGLGLAIVKEMVELHGGRVEAFSEGIGKGAKFTIRLPL